MDKRERVLKALDIEEPDIVPITELWIDPPHIEAITGKQYLTSPKETRLSANKIDENNARVRVLCYKKLGLDMIADWESAPDGWKPELRSNGTIVDEWGRVQIYDSRCRVWCPCKGSVKTLEDFESRPFPDPHAPGRLRSLEYTIKFAGEEMAVAGCVRTPFAILWEAFGAERFSLLLYEKPHSIKKMIEKITDYNVELIKSMIDLGVDLIVSDGDLAEAKGPMMSPRHFRDIVFPSMKREVTVAHQKGVKYVKHTDGNIYIILDDLANIVDGLHSIDPSAGMDIEVVKQKYGHKLALIGNIDASETLCRKSKDEVIQEVKECIRKAAPGGGFILCSSNSWYAEAKLENCLAMIEAGRKYGKYPVSIAKCEEGAEGPTYIDRQRMPLW